jgi:hypothetical protein
MKPKLIHQQAMDYSFKAKQAMEDGNTSVAFELYKQAADLESQVAEFYFDKPELEPTRSIIIRSAAFMNLKAGLLETAQRFIFFGLLNTKDELIKSQLNNALELTVSLKNLSPQAVCGEYNYLNILRQRSVNYILEPSNLVFGHSVSLVMIKDFTEGYLKSLKAYALSKLKKISEIKDTFEAAVEKEVDRLINPLLTNSCYGSFKFSIANDFLSRVGEDDKLVKLKSEVVLKYHNEIFINPLSDNDIEQIKANFADDEINEIFRPLSKIKSNNTSYKIGYYDLESFNKIYVSRIENKQRKKLLTVKQISQEDIGELESTIIHTRSLNDGKVSKRTIFKEHLKSYEFDIKTNVLEPKNISPLILSDDILINVSFNSETGFKFIFDDFEVEFTDIEYGRGLTGFYTIFYNKVIHLINSPEKSEQELRDWEIIKKLIGNPDALIK